MTNNLSVHLQPFPDLSFIKEEKRLVQDMDLVRDICTSALFIRDKQNLKVRQPLSKLTIYGKRQQLENILTYGNLIKDELNVKEVEVVFVTDDKLEVADFKLQINFKKVGAKLGNKMKEITISAKQDKWQKIIDPESGYKRIKIAGEILKEEDEEFEIKLVPKDQECAAALPSNDCVVSLDINITEELKKEGIARDIIRFIQESRKQADFNISDHIKIIFYSSKQEIIDAISDNINRIKENTLADIIEIVDNQNKAEGFQENCGYQLTNLSNQKAKQISGRISQTI